jgi:hypothetical protein
MAATCYNSLKRDIAKALIDLSADTIKVMLVTSSYTQDIDAHTKRSDITNEVVGTGYTAGGSALANKTVTANNTSDKGVFDADDLSWAAATITARGAVLYKSRGGAASADELIAYYDFGSNIVSTGSTFLITWDATGILLIN